MTETSEKDFLEKYDPNDYHRISAAVDLAIFTIKNGQLAILLVERGDYPEKGKWALPGGFMQDESAEAAAIRELAEEAGVLFENAENFDMKELEGKLPDRELKKVGGFLEQLKTYSAPGRDPRMHVLSVAFLAFVPNMPEPEAGDDAAQAKWWPLVDVLGSEPEVELAFDHEKIISDGLARVRAKIEYAPIAPKFLDSEMFTISELRRIYEVIWGANLLPSNFRRKVQSVQDFLIPVGEQGSPSFDGGRKAALYRLGSTEILFPPLRQPKDDPEIAAIE